MVIPLEPFLGKYYPFCAVIGSVVALLVGRAFSAKLRVATAPTNKVCSSLDSSARLTTTFRPRCGQASLEMTVAYILGVLLLFGCLKVFLWINERVVSRQTRYEAGRLEAGRFSGEKPWTEPSSKLKIFNADP